MLINLREWELGEKFLRNDWEHKESNQSPRKTQQIGAASSWQVQHQEAVSVSVCWSIAKPKITEGFTHFDGEHIANLAFWKSPEGILSMPSGAHAKPRPAEWPYGREQKLWIDHPAWHLAGTLPDRTSRNTEKPMSLPGSLMLYLSWQKRQSQWDFDSNRLAKIKHKVSLKACLA